MSVLNASDDASDALDAGDRRPQAPTALNCVAGRECLLQCVARRARPAATLHWFISGMSVSVLSHIPADSLVNPAAAQSGPAGDVSGLWHLIAPALSTQDTNPSNRTQPNGAYRYPPAYSTLLYSTT